MGFDLDSLTSALASELDERRLLHTLGVVQSAAVLAELNGVDASRAAVAALLHDCAKPYAADELLELARRGGLPPSELERSFPAVWHAPAGAVVARERYAIEDEEILDAIANHPLGKADPSELLLVLMAADYCEPTRDFEGVEGLRRLVRQDLRGGVESILLAKAQYLRARGKAVHPRVYETIESLRAKAPGKE